MLVQLESPDKYSIQSYTESHIIVASQPYESHCIITAKGVDAKWLLSDVTQLTIESQALKQLLYYAPDIIIIGLASLRLVSIELQKYLAEKRIGLEQMTLGAACRTFNVLLSEQRNVVLGVIFN